MGLSYHIFDFFFNSKLGSCVDRFVGNSNEMCQGFNSQF